MPAQPDETWEAIVVGAGPAGLTAALYLARYRRRVLVLHDGSARALQIPSTHNVPSHPHGVSGRDLIEQMAAHAGRYGACIEEARVIDAQKLEEDFVLRGDDGRQWRSRSLILATGLRLNQIPLDPETHQRAIERNVLRYCPICDGYEHIGRRIGVIGCDAQGAGEALFLRRYSDDITLIPRAFAELTADERAKLERAKVRVIDAAATDYTLEEQAMVVKLSNGSRERFDIVYPALGTRPRTELAKALGIRVTDDGCLPADAPFEAHLPGLYSAGDIVEGLDQISVAFSHGAIAATRVHNWLRECDGEAVDRQG